MQYVTGKVTRFTPDHRQDKGTAISLLGGGCLILEDGKGLGIALLDPLDRRALAAALQAQNPPNYEVGPVWIGCGKLCISYTNRGEPFRQGVLISLERLAVFLDSGDIPDMVRLLENGTSN